MIFSTTPDGVQTARCTMCNALLMRDMRSEEGRVQMREFIEKHDDGKSCGVIDTSASEP